MKLRRIFQVVNKDASLQPGLFEQLETGFDVYGITNFGISVTTMEEVFLKVSWNICDIF